MNPPLIVTTDPLLREELLRLTAAAGLVPDVVENAPAALPRWRRAATVLIGTDVLDAMVQLTPSRRAGVHVVGLGPAADEAFRGAVALGSDSVLELPEASPWLGQLLGELLDPAIESGLLLGVVAGCGGAGASVLACALAQHAGRSGPSLLVDLDPGGPGLDRLFGLESKVDVGWEALAASSGRLGGQALRDAVPRSHGVGVLTWQGLPAPVPEETVGEVLAAGARGHRVVVVDLSRGAGLEMAAARLDRVIVVVRPDLTGLASAGRVLTRLGENVDVVLRGAWGHTLPVAEVTDRPVLTRMRDQRGLAEALELGIGPVPGRRGPLVAAAATILGSASTGGRAA